MKVYVVTSGCYSEYHIVAICGDREEAEKICALINENDDPQVSEWDTENYKIRDDGKKLYHVYCFLDDNRNRIIRMDVDENDPITSAIAPDRNEMADFSNHPFHPNILFVIRAKDKIQAQKIAYDRFAQWAAEKEGLL